MPRYFAHLSYDGTNYCGWQVQANAPSVQQTINEGMEKLLRQPIKSMGCGRTDTGVHAKDFYMHFDTVEEIADIPNLLFRLNSVLPDDITVFDVFQVEENANTRFDATERTYEYYIHFDKDPFIKKYSFYQGYYSIDWEKILEASSLLREIKDFTSLCLPSEDFKTNICHLTRVSWDILPSHHLILKPLAFSDNSTPIKSGYEKKPGECIRFTISSNRFLRGMVRKTVGTLLMVGKNKLNPNEFIQTVQNQEQFKIHYLAPPTGLFLSKVSYPFNS